MDLEALRRRQQGIGGSDAAAVLGAPSAYRTQLAVYESKVMPVPAEERVFGPRYWGTALEQAVADAFWLEHPLGAEFTMIKPGTFARPGVPLVATPDRLVYRPPSGQYIDPNSTDFPDLGDPLAGLEVKTADRSKADEWGVSGGDKIPEQYWVQIQHYYMVLPTIVHFHVAVLIGGNDYRTYAVNKDESFCQDLLAAETAWWERHVIPKIPPMITDRDIATLKKLYPGTDGTEVDLSHLEHWHFVRTETMKMISALETTKDMCTAQILGAMGNAAIGKIAGVKGRYTRRQIDRRPYEVEEGSYIDCRFIKGGG